LAADHPLRSWLYSDKYSFRWINTIFRTDHYDIWCGSIQSFERINTAFRTDHYDLWYGSRINMIFQRINTIFRMDQYGLSNGSLRSLVRINMIFQRISTIFQMDQYSLLNGPMRSLVRINTGRYSTVCVSATSTRNLTFLAQITCDLHGERNARYLVLVVTVHVPQYSTVCASHMYVRRICY
jgi:hypothetical protein